MKVSDIQLAINDVGLTAFQGFEAKIVADSITQAGKRITTMQLRYPRFIHSEFMTHRVFSRNASSSRAIPVTKMIDQVRKAPAMPIHWGKNQPGMQANAELEGKELQFTQEAWQVAAECVADIANGMSQAGAHKQIANRILEPFQFISVVVTSTEWDNFWELRDDKDAQPEIHLLARMMRLVMNASEPTLLMPGEWHIPYVKTSRESKYAPLQYLWNGEAISIEAARKCSAAACARTSYNNHDGTKATVEENAVLHDRLVVSEPKHASPVEHQATPDKVRTFAKLFEYFGLSRYYKPKLHGNFVGWVQYRKVLN